MQLKDFPTWCALIPSYVRIETSELFRIILKTWRGIFATTIVGESLSYSTLKKFGKKSWRYEDKRKHFWKRIFERKPRTIYQKIGLPQGDVLLVLQNVRIPFRTFLYDYQGWNIVVVEKKKAWVMWDCRDPLEIVTPNQWSFVWLTKLFFSPPDTPPHRLGIFVVTRIKLEGWMTYNLI